MFNFTELAYVLNGTPISFQNTKNKLYLSLDTSNSNFKVNGYHPYLSNIQFKSEIKTITQFTVVLSSIPDYINNTPRSIISYGTQVSLMSPNEMFLVATNNGELRLEGLKESNTLSVKSLPINSKFTIIDPYNPSNFSKPLLYNDEVVLRSTFGGYLVLSFNQENPDLINTVNSNGMMIIEESIWKLIKITVPFIPDWVYKRKYLNYNINSYLYNLETSLDNVNKGIVNMSKGNKDYSGPCTGKEKPSLTTLSIPMQDKCLVEDLLLTMIGLEGNYIKRIITHTTFKDFKIEFAIEPYFENPTCDQSLLSLATLMLPLSFYYNSITNYLNINTNIETGLVSKSFCLGLRKLIREYVLFVNQLDCQMRIGAPIINLLQLRWLCQPCMKLLENLHKLCQKCQLIKGGALINIIYSAYLHETDTQMKKMYKFLLDKSFMPYFEMLQMWVCRGHLENEHEFQEFMVFSPKDYSKLNLRENYYDFFWEMKFKLNPIHIPEFISRIAEKILFIGKSLNIIHECGKIIQCPYEKEFEEFNSSSSIEGTSSPSLTSKSKDNSSLIREENPTEKELLFENTKLIQFERLIDQIYNWSNSALKNILFNEMNFASLLTSMKKFYLMGSGDFFTHFIDLANEYFFQSKKEIKFEKIQTHIDNALRMSSLNVDSNKDLFAFVLSNIVISMEKHYLDKYTAILNSDDNDIHSITDQLDELNNETQLVDIDNLKVLESLVLECNIKWPLNLIFSKKNIIKYKILFRHLFNLKFVERELAEAWIIQQNFKDFRLQQYFRPSLFLRDSMLNFVKNIIYYVFNEVIEPNYLKLIEELIKSLTLEELIIKHAEFLDKCLKECLLDDDTMFGYLNNVIQCCLMFSRIITKYYNNALLMEKEIHQKNIGQINYKGLNEIERKNKRKEEQSQAVEQIFINVNSKFPQVFNNFRIAFETRLKTLLDNIKTL